MRTRKYRAYHDKWGWAEPDDIDIWGDGSVYVTYRHEDGDKICNYTEKTKELHVMDYSGLNDQNYKEIYENHIVKCTYADGSHEIGVVRFIDGCFDILFGKGRDYLKCFTINHAEEIIGNEFENPELLE